MTNLTSEFSFHQINVHSPYDWSCHNKLHSHWLVETVLHQTHSILLELVPQAHPHCLSHPPVLESVFHLHQLTVNHYKSNSLMMKEIRKNQRSWFSEHMLPSVSTFTQSLKFLYNDKTILQWMKKAHEFCYVIIQVSLSYAIVVISGDCLPENLSNFAFLIKKNEYETML